LLAEQVRTDDAISQSYSALIAARIEQNWSRPPSARKGIQCELEIQMVPTGYVIDVQITKSSGNAAFDRSAVQAVKKIERFNEVKDIPSRIFEQYFRTFKLNFNPKDLRL
jgi:colicin import membrane protein